MSEYKEFRVKDTDPNFTDPYWDMVYGVIEKTEVEKTEGAFDRIHRMYIINANDPGHSFGITANEVPVYREILDWIESRNV